MSSVSVRDSVSVRLCLKIKVGNARGWMRNGVGRARLPVWSVWAPKERRRPQRRNAPREVCLVRTRTEQGAAQEDVQRAEQEPRSCKAKNSKGCEPCSSHERSGASSHLEPQGRFAPPGPFISGLLPPKSCRPPFCCLKLPKTVKSGGGSPGKVMKPNLISNECFCYFTQGSFRSLLSRSGKEF